MYQKTCSIDECGRRVKARGMCDTHYVRWRRGSKHLDGVPINHAVGGTMAAEERFWTFVQRTETCWLWTGSLDWSGYGHFWRSGTLMLAHRWAYEHFTGEVPKGYQIDHLCRVRHCVNPSHLEAVTPSINVQRGAHVRRDLRVARNIECATIVVQSHREKRDHE